MLENCDFTMLNTGQHTYQNVYGGTSVLGLSFASTSLANRCEWSAMNSTLGSDHVPTFIDVNEKLDFESEGSSNWQLKTANWQKFRNLLDRSNSNQLFDIDINKYNNNVTNTIIDCAKDSISKTNKRYTKPKSVPYWNSDCSQAIHNRNKARNKLNKNRTEANFIDYNRTKALAQHTIRNAQRDSWQNYCTSIDKNTKLGRVWKMSKRMGGHRGSCFGVPTLTSDKGVHLTNADKAEALAETFASASATKNYPDTFIEHKTRFENNQKHLFSNEIPSISTDPINEPFSLHELNCAVKTCKNGKAAGPDDIPYEFIKHFPESFNIDMLKFYNYVWCTGKLPTAWKHAVILPLHKAQKPKEETASYRPISLTSCLCKVLEKLVTNRLTHYLESNHLLVNCQAGFRKNRSTIDQILKLQDTITKYNSNRGFTVAAFLDFEKAYDMLWRPGLLTKVKRLGIHGKMFSFIENFISDRTFQVKVGSELSEPKILENGTPQGSVISCILFLIMINDMAEVCPGVELSLFADDSATTNLEGTCHYLLMIFRGL
jgi:hypothetical protein